MVKTVIDISERVQSQMGGWVGGWMQVNTIQRLLTATKNEIKKKWLAGCLHLADDSGASTRPDLTTWGQFIKWQNRLMHFKVVEMRSGYKTIILQKYGIHTASSITSVGQSHCVHLSVVYFNQQTMLLMQFFC